MPGCCHLSRRQFLRWAALVGATPLVSALVDQERAYAQSSGATALPINLELVTLTETSAVITWFTGDPVRPDAMGRFAAVPADTEVLLGTSPQNLTSVYHDTTPTPYHYVELTGLEPGQTYLYVARSGGVAATPSTTAYGNPVGTSTLRSSPSGPFLFTTPRPPPGRFLFAIALCNDLHLGETVAGLATTQQGMGIPPGISQVDGRPPYTEVMAQALGPEARARGAQLLLANGDVSGGAGAVELGKAKSYLDTFGRYQRDYLVTRGNHDRIHDDHDSFRDLFFPRLPTWFSHEAFGLRILGLDTYDKVGDGGDNGVLSDAQWVFVRDELGKDKDRPTLVLGHHPVTVESTLVNAKPVSFDLDPHQAMQLEELYAATPGVFLNHAGHTHRNKRTLSATAPDVVFQESAAVKEYPGGFTLLRVFTGGYALNFYKFKAPLAQEWAERSRPEYLGLAPFYEFGNVLDRNSVVARDFSGLTAAATATTATTAPAGRRAVLPATGGGGPPAVAVVALAAGVAAAHVVASHPHSV